VAVVVLVAVGVVYPKQQHIKGAYQMATVLRVAFLKKVREEKRVTLK
jgi:hypothetical protein